MHTSLAHARATVEHIASLGSVMMTPGPPFRRHLVGAVRWGAEPLILWFIANGDSEVDAHSLGFDEVQLVEQIGVCFLFEGRLVGYLSVIEHANVTDVEDYRIGWRIWTDLEPLRRPMIERAFALREASTASEFETAHLSANSSESGLSLSEPFHTASARVRASPGDVSVNPSPGRKAQ